MSIQEWGAISEMVGAIAIIVSLIYVGVQIRQSTQATRVMTSQAFVESHCGAITQITRDPAFWDVYWRGLSGLSNLQGGEGLHADLAARLNVTLELGDPATARQPPAPDRPFGAIDAVHLEDLLGQIHAHTSKLHDDSSSFRDW